MTQLLNQKCPTKISQNSYFEIFRTTRINVNGILIEYEGEDSGIGLLFASKAAVQVMVMVMMRGICKMMAKKRPRQR